MRIKRWRAAFAMLLVAGNAMALECSGPSGFDDVAQADIFCTDVSWLANRGITLGCSAGLFCPGQNVTRAQMALFMQRLGTAVSPTAFAAAAVNQVLNPLTALIEPPSPAHIWCATPLVPEASYPRMALLTGWVSMAAGAGGANIQIYPAVSMDDGATWAREGGLVFNRQDMEASKFYTFPLSNIVTIAAGTTLRAGIFPRKAAGTAVSLSAGECRLHLLVFSQTGTGVPFDPGGDQAQGR